MKMCVDRHRGGERRGGVVYVGMCGRVCRLMTISFYFVNQVNR